MFFYCLPLYQSSSHKINNKIMPTNNDEQSWSQVKETILMINVAVARIEHAMLEGDDSFTTLSKSFAVTVDSINNITHATKDLENSSIKNTIQENCQNISHQIDGSIVAFQFYDKLSQRMALVSKTLDSLNEVLEDKAKKNKEDVWLNLQNMIRSKYTLDADQEMFDAVLGGAPIEEALKIAVQKTSESEIEFF